MPIDTSKLIAAINKGFKQPVAAPLSSGIRSDVRNVIPTGIEALDKHVLGIGGLPCGRLVELFADEGVGKTSLALQCIAGAQAAGAAVFLAETECGLESSRPAVFGVKFDDVILLNPGHWGEVMAQVGACLDAMPKNGKGLFVLDSVAATRSKEEAEQGLAEEGGFDRRPKAISDFMRKLGPVAMAKQVSFLFINQTRTKIGVMFGNNTTTPGGAAMKFHSSIRLCMYQGKSIKGAGDLHTGKYVSVQAVKNRFQPPWRKCKLKLDFAKGWDADWSSLNLAKELKLMKPREQSVQEAKRLLEKHGWNTGAAAATDGESQTEEASNLDEIEEID